MHLELFCAKTEAGEILISIGHFLRRGPSESSCRDAKQFQRESEMVTHTDLFKWLNPSELGGGGKLFREKPDHERVSAYFNIHDYETVHNRVIEMLPHCNKTRAETDIPRYYSYIK